MSLWGIGGARMIIFLAGLQGIPESYYEAAQIDGANSWQKFRFITLPMLSPTMFFNLILGTIGSFQVFTNAYVMTNGGPGNASLFYVLYLFRNAFEYFKLGKASAMEVGFSSQCCWALPWHSFGMQGDGCIMKALRSEEGE